jgi:opacity protein-like surface antigen
LTNFNLTTMKKIILTLIAFVGVTSINAQEQIKTNSNDIKFGLKAGLNIANMNVSGDFAPETKATPNFHIGAFVEIGINEKWAFQPELVYSMQGAKFDMLYTEGTDIYNTKNTFKLHYLNIPLMFKYNENNLFFEAGPQIGFLTSAKLKTSIEGFGSGNQDVKELFKTIDFGLGFGIGYNFSEQVGANLRYNFGLNNIAETEDGDNTKIKNSVFALSLAYKFK